MPSPFTWDIGKPAGGDGINIGDDQIRTDKTQLRDVLRTLIPFGTPTTGWRNVQINNDTYLTQNAKFDGTNWSHDDTTLDATALLYLSTGEVRIIFRKAAASTWLSSAWLLVAEFKNVASAVNYLQLLAAATGVGVEIKALGTDANIDLILSSKGTGKVRANGGTAAVGPVFESAQTSTVDVVNTTVETDLYSVSLPQNTLTAGRSLRLVLWGDVLKNVAGTLTIRIKLGATTLFDSTAITFAASASRQWLGFSGEIFAISTASQRFLMTSPIYFPVSTDVLLIGSTAMDAADGSNMNAFTGQSSAAENNGVGALTFKVTAQWSVASASLSARALGVKVQVWP